MYLLLVWSWKGLYLVGRHRAFVRLGTGGRRCCLGWLVCTIFIGSPESYTVFSSSNVHKNTPSSLLSSPLHLHPHSHPSLPLPLLLLENRHSQPMQPPILRTLRLPPPLQHPLPIIQRINLDPQRPTAIQHTPTLPLAPPPQRQVAAGTGGQGAEDVDFGEELDVRGRGGGGGFPGAAVV